MDLRHFRRGGHDSAGREERKSDRDNHQQTSRKR
jgi:hypothetical protein